MRKILPLLPRLLLLAISFPLFSGCEADSKDASPSPNGTGGSMARFAIAGNHLYTVSNSHLQVYDISLPQSPEPMNKISLGLNIETIFPYGNKLFIGSRTGMHIYDNTNPAQPVLLSRYDHVQSCDPVVVQGNYAYVTLRSGTDCRFGQNLLDVIDIAQPQSPRVVNTLPMQNPHGLGVDGNSLFVSEGDFGLKVFDVTDPVKPMQTQFMQNIKTYDVIPQNNRLLVIGSDGLYQYDYSNPKALAFLSKIPVSN